MPATSGPGTAASVEEAGHAFMDAARRSTTLYELSAAYQEVLNLLEDPDADAAALEQRLDAIAGQITHKAEAIGGLIKQCESMAAARKAEADRMRDLGAADARNAERLRDYLLRHMQAIGTERIDTARFRLSVRTNPPAVQVIEEALIPEELIHTVTTKVVDRRAILEVYKATGEIVSGVDITRGTRLEIR